MFKNFFNVIIVISGVTASFWKVFIKFRWHGKILTALEVAGNSFIPTGKWGFKKGNIERYRQPINISPLDSKPQQSLCLYIMFQFKSQFHKKPVMWPESGSSCTVSVHWKTKTAGASFWSPDTFLIKLWLYSTYCCPSC